MSSTTAVGGGTAAPGRGSGALAVLQRIGRSLMLPIAVLPAAGLLLRLGQSDVMSEDPANDAWISFDGVDRVAEVFAGAGSALFNWLPLLFAVGVAIGFARKSDGSTALAAVVGYLVFHYVSMNMFFHSDELRPRVINTLHNPDNPAEPTEALNYAAGNPTQVFGGIVLGITAALLYQRYYRIKLPSWLAFFGGRRFVPIITAFAAILWGLIFGLVWPVLGGWLTNFGEWVERNSELGAGVYGVVNRLLLPLGLHHIPNNVVWFQIPECTVDGKTITGDLQCYLAGAEGTGWSMAGYFPILMFALPAAALAIWQAAPKHRRPAVGGIMFSAALTAFVTGITEPIEFAFIFVAPVLFGVHALLTGVSMALADAFGMKLGFSFSAGAIDMIINGSKDNTKNLVGLIIMGLIFAVIYYVLFTVLIRAMNIATPGREPAGEESVAADPQADPVAAGSARTERSGPAEPAEPAPGGTATKTDEK
jgi:N-acetylglucosamine PTS system EIICBA or EIICB component